MAKKQDKKKNKKKVKPLMSDNRGNKVVDPKERESIREEIRSIITAAKAQNLIRTTTEAVRKARTFTADDIFSFIGDLKVKTTNEVKKVVHWHNGSMQTSTEKETLKSDPKPIKAEKPNVKKDNSMSYYDRWYNLVSDKGGKKEY